jgi:predicted AlkP superfamily pyrophosphatase or phosphodiesterase
MSHPRDLFDVVGIAMGRPVEWPIDDALRANVTAAILKTYRPDVTLVHLLELDSAEHTNGPDTPEALATLERIDAHITTILAGLENAGIADETNVAIVSDHGFLAISTRLQPNTRFKDAGLITVDRGRIASWQAYFHSSGGSGYVFLKDRSNTAVRAQVRELLDQLAADPKSGIRTIWTEADLKRAGAHPEAVFGIDMEDGFYTGNGHEGLLGNPGDKGGHGFNPERRELHASFIGAGPAFKGKGNLGIVRMTQIAPTLATLIGVSLSPLADRAIDLGQVGRVGQMGRVGQVGRAGTGSKTH